MHFGPKRQNIKYLFFGVLVLLGLAYWIWGGNGDETAAAYEFSPVAVGDIEEAVTAQGKLEPKEFVDVGAQVSGQLKKLHVEIGDNVEKGALIAEIDPQIYTAQVEAETARLKTLNAQLAEQLAQVAFTESVYIRNQTLMKADAVSKETLESSMKEFKAAQARANSFRAQIEEAESQLEEAKANLGYTKIYAPISGTVVSQTSKEGQTLNANQTAPVIAQIADLDLMTVRAQVAEADVSRLQTDMDVYFTTLGSERKWHGKVRQILPSPDATVLDVVLYNALVDVENKDRSLLTGMSTQMFFVLGNAEKTLLIPARALGKKIPEEKDVEGEAYEVLVKRNGTLETRTIHVGLLNRRTAQVLNGLKEGEQVAIPTAATLAEQTRRGPRI